MPSLCWSHTAPIVTQEEVEAEKAALSDEERHRLHDDLYGTYEPILETPQLIEEKISEMNEFIDAIDDDDKESFLAAQEKCADHCNDEEFRLMFLRADRFDAEKAAKRLVCYWEEKLDLFGPDHTYRRMSIEDLLRNPNDVELMESGAMYPLPEKDEAGRAILFVNRIKLTLPQFDRESKLRLVFYLFHCLCEGDEITQKKGFVLVASPPENFVLNFDRKFVKRTFNAKHVPFPGRLDAFHMTVPAFSFVSMVFLPVLYQLMGKEKRSRFVIHRYQFTPKETRTTFTEYGIKEHNLPFDFGGPIEFEYNAWLDQRRAIEASRR